MIAWVLIAMLGSQAVYSVPGIATEQACKDLADKIAPLYTSRSPTFDCLPYSATQAK